MSRPPGSLLPRIPHQQVLINAPQAGGTHVQQLPLCAYTARNEWKTISSAPAFSLLIIPFHVHFQFPSVLKLSTESVELCLGLFLLCN